ncbi:MAG: DUF3038 domain-containing protein [Oscillatoriales cyanobacterium RM1_1_9]|nr:DUF3038 domain-containing protein [Oscillatoriales cyanobacterium SM2_3_0]NJO47580.1 DUF3038 domain-containing protein [Oscillatoriales cyanobacterium RM2_1_1]NJO71479.1 DUF3038 domain-containing protein [Oscillatoriales cyanobacterium RM1_1_9]
MTHDSLLNWQKLQLTAEPELQHLPQITRHLELTLIALKALISITPEALQRIAAQMNLMPGLSERIMQASVNVEAPLTLDEAKSLALLICHLANQNQPEIRRAVTLLEQLTQQGDDPAQSALLQTYLTTFQQQGQSRSYPFPDVSIDISTEQLEPLAFKLLIDLLFCSNSDSPQRFWSALIKPQFSA